MNRVSRFALILLAGLSAVATAAGALPKLPAPRAFPMGEGSPGAVEFRHESHVDSDRPACTGCHPSTFSILRPAATADDRPVTHARMEAGRACGTCHGKTATGFDDCTFCHATE